MTEQPFGSSYKIKGILTKNRWTRFTIWAYSHRGWQGTEAFAAPRISARQSSRAWSCECYPKKVILYSHRYVCIHNWKNYNPVLWNVWTLWTVLVRKYPKTDSQDRAFQPEIPTPPSYSLPAEVPGSPTLTLPALPDADKPSLCSLGSNQAGTISYLLSQEPPSPNGRTLVPGGKAAEPEEDPISDSVTCCDFTLVDGKASSCCLMVMAVSTLRSGWSLAPACL